MDLAKQRANELLYQKETLRREFADWRARSQARQPLEKHNSQIERLTTQLEGFLATAGDPDLEAPSFEENERIYTRLLGAHRIWAYFRSKLALRDVAWLRDSLKVADELAWKCYEPALLAARTAGTVNANDLKEPPLVFFTTDATPYAQARDMPFAPEGITSRDALDFGKAILKLPIPLVGIPWFQLDHLPSAVVIAHEVGHAVDRDFGLRAVLAPAVEALAIPAERKTAWLKWLPELLADAYGILGAGAAFVYTLTGYLADAPEIVERETRSAADWQTYPTRHLRVLFNLKVLELLDLSIDDLTSAWHDAYTFHQLPAFEEDLEPVAEAILGTPLPVFGGKRLADVIRFTPEQDQKSAQKQARNIVQGFQLDSSTAVRTLMAAATLAYVRDPQQYEQRDANAGVLNLIVAAIPPGTRSAVLLNHDQIARRQQADAAAGAALLALFG
jgi:hypothetical protein